MVPSSNLPVFRNVYVSDRSVPVSRSVRRTGRTRFPKYYSDRSVPFSGTFLRPVGRVFRTFIRHARPALRDVYQIDRTRFREHYPCGQSDLLSKTFTRLVGHAFRNVHQTRRKQFPELSSDRSGPRFPEHSSDHSDPFSGTFIGLQSACSSRTANHRSDRSGPFFRNTFI